MFQKFSTYLPFLHFSCYTSQFLIKMENILERRLRPIFGKLTKFISIKVTTSKRGHSTTYRQEHFSSLNPTRKLNFKKLKRS